VLLSKRLQDSIRSLGPLARDFQVLVVEAERLERELNLRQRRISALNTINQLAPLIALIKEQEDVELMLRRILKAAIELSRAGRGLVVLRDLPNSEGFRIYASIGMQTDDASHEDAKLSRSLIKQILQRGEGVVTSNIQQDERFEPGASLLATNIRSVMTTPIKLEGEVIGAIYVDSELSSNLFNEEDLEVFSAFASHAAVTLNLATSLQEKRDLHIQSILALVHAVEAADEYTAGHSKNVGYYAKGIAEELGMIDKEVEMMLIAGYLHDVGKIAVPNSVTKADKLTDEEWKAMRMHPIYGERILRNSPALKDILPAVRWHHERWDGRGYPDGLKGNEIHPYARIISVGDSFDAMTTDRPYRKAYDVDYALKEIEANIGKMYERAAAEAFLRAFAKGRLQLAERSTADATLVHLLGESEVVHR